ncbi:hypothetical protein [Streptomyces sp. NPDC020747]|uniref:hypothetical protein n=1 Tax=Streptomyces sp. NPDC020747 TaxID=3365086 RepID=UPI0037A8D376
MSSTITPIRFAAVAASSATTRSSRAEPRPRGADCRPELPGCTLQAVMNDSASVRVTGTFSEATTVDLLGRPISGTPAPDELELALGPWEIRTVVLR